MNRKNEHKLKRLRETGEQGGIQVASRQGAAPVTEQETDLEKFLKGTGEAGGRYGILAANLNPRSSS
ncbi:MAG: hypothetical protein BZ138_06590 [Methanosphaera sp. rholeuAM270]|nr:MAG: hypothetical protein BZ138_06590 [Methanosphaera sp. rholeuAM270]